MIWLINAALHVTAHASDDASLRVPDEEKDGIPFLRLGKSGLQM